MGDLEEVPGSWLQIPTTLAVVVTWGVNYQMEDSPLCISDFVIKIKINFKKTNVHTPIFYKAKEKPQTREQRVFISPKYDV